MRFTSHQEKTKKLNYYRRGPIGREKDFSGIEGDCMDVYGHQNFPTKFSGILSLLCEMSCPYHLHQATVGATQ